MILVLYNNKHNLLTPHNMYSKHEISKKNLQSLRISDTSQLLIPHNFWDLTTFFLQIYKKGGGRRNEDSIFVALHLSLNQR